ncbi:MAG: hypothetical protein ACJ8AT_30960 [Hyalangium sp.]|uniref:hypothetical protein n=1 Tax=Hyalangium sp. TaxID=2028555 RepID=UPI00389AB90A
MKAMWTGSALTLHNLGLAAGFGGSLFGQMALHPAVKTIDDTKERGEILNQAWKGFSPVNAFALGSVALTWIIGRSSLSGGEIDDDTRGLVLAKDVLVGVYTLAGLGSLIVGRVWGTREPPVESGSEPAAETPELDVKGQTVVNWLGRANIVAAAGIIALTAILNIKAGRSHKWSLLSWLLP